MRPRGVLRLKAWRDILANKRHRRIARVQLAACRRLVHKRRRQADRCDLRGWA